MTLLMASAPPMGRIGGSETRHALDLAGPDVNRVGNQGRQAFIRPRRFQTLDQRRERIDREVDRPGLGAHEETPRQESREGVELGCDLRLRLLDAGARQDGISTSS